METIHQQLAISSKIMKREYQSLKRRKSTSQSERISVTFQVQEYVRSLISYVFAAILMKFLRVRAEHYKFREHANQTTTLTRAVIPASLYTH